MSLGTIFKVNGFGGAVTPWGEFAAAKTARDTFAGLLLAAYKARYPGDPAETYGDTLDHPNGHEACVILCDAPDDPAGLGCPLPDGAVIEEIGQDWQGPPP